MTRTDAEIEIYKLVRSLYILQANKTKDFVMLTKTVQNTKKKPT